MAVWIDPAIEFIVREAHQDMGACYEDLNVVHLITDEIKAMVLAWNEGEITASYNIEQQGVYVAVRFEPQIIGYQKRQVGRAMYDFENALVGGTPDFQPEDPSNPGMILPGYPAHHNVAGHPIRQEDMVVFGLDATYEPLTRGRPGERIQTDEQKAAKLPKEWWPDHIIQKLTVESTSIKFDPNIKAWRGRLFVHAHLANAGFGGIA